MDYSEFISFINEARKKEKEERIYLQWLVQLPNMNNENYVAYSEYYDRITGKNIDYRPTEAIVEETEQLEKKIKGGGE